MIIFCLSVSLSLSVCLSLSLSLSLSFSLSLFLSLSPLHTHTHTHLTELHTCVDDDLSRFYYLYGQLGPDRQDLATRWTDFFEQTLLYR